MYKSDLLWSKNCVYLEERKGKENLLLNDPVNAEFFDGSVFLWTLGSHKASCHQPTFAVLHVSHQPCNFPDCVKQLYFQGGASRSENTQGAKILLTYKCFLWMRKEKKNSPQGYF